MKKYFKHSGQSLVEFALVFPLFFFLVTGLFDLGRAVFAYSTMNTAVREGTRYAIMRSSGTTDAEIEDKVRSYFFGVNDFEDTNNTDITISRVGTTKNPKINIHIVYTFKPVTPGLALVLGQGKSISIEAESEMFITPKGK
jgi:Flp pilus assembly protein TadG